MSADKSRVRRNRVARKPARAEHEDAADRPILDRPCDAQELDELSQMESELGAMQHELEQVQKEREILENQRRVLKQVATTPSAKPDPAACIPRGPQDKCELRTQVERLRESLAATQISQEAWESRALALENHNSKAVGLQDAEQQQQVLALARQKYRESQDELEEMRALIEDQAGHLEGYRNKYLQAQQQVEEQRRQMQHLEAEHERLADQVQLEMHRIKAEFQDKLQVLLPLPDILKAVQAKLHEEKHLRAIAERNNSDLSHDLSAAHEKNAEIDSLRAQQQSWLDERHSLISHIDSLQRQSNKLKEDVTHLRQVVAQYEAAGAHNEKLYEDMVMELGHVKTELEAFRQTSGRQAKRQRDTMDTMRRSFHSQIGELERELVQTRAHAAAAHKEKEELQSRLQTQLANITQSFGQAQERIKSLQSVVDVLKSNVLNIDSLPEPSRMKRE